MTKEKSFYALPPENTAVRKMCLMVYKIVEERVYVIGSYHDLQDYESLFR